MTEKKYVPENFWDERLDREWNLRGVGHLGYGLRYNNWLYKSQARALKKLVRNAGIDLPNSDVLDVGSGTGFWLDFFRDNGARKVAGADLADSAVRQLQERYPDLDIHQLNIGDEPQDIGKFDVVNIISVLYHIVDEDAFARAIENLAALVKPGGWLILSDKMASTDVVGNPHVRFRSEERYRTAAEKLSLSIESTEVMTSLMNGGFAGLTRRMPGPLKSARGKFENWFPSAIYWMDGTGMFDRWANMRVMAMQKSPDAS